MQKEEEEEERDDEELVKEEEIYALHRILEGTNSKGGRVGKYDEYWKEKWRKRRRRIKENEEREETNVQCTKFRTCYRDSRGRRVGTYHR